MAVVLPMRVLVVDDSSAQRMIISILLKERGHEVIEAVDGEEAWEIVRQGGAQLVITDWNMPKMNGLELCRKVREELTPHYVYIILLTVRSERISLLEGMEAGADDFVTKPIDGEELELRVRAGERVIRLEHDLDVRNKELSQAFDTIRNDLEFAAAAQRALLPEPATLQGFEWQWLYLPSQYLAGDIFGFFPLDEGHLGFYQIDVAGHGVPSALLSVTLSNVLSISQVHGSIVKREKQQPPYYQILSPPEVVHELNQRFMPDHPGGQYFTMIYGIVETETGRVTLTQAGHPSPVQLIHSTFSAARVGAGGYPVALVKNATYEAVTLQLDAGDRLIMFSDGLTECENPDGEQFSAARLVELIEETAHLPLAELEEEFSRVIHEWNGSEDFEDDISLLMLERSKA